MITQLIKAPKLTDTTGNIDLGHIELFRDHEDPFKFYYLNNTPRLQFDQITKRPVLIIQYSLVASTQKKRGFNKAILLWVSICTLQKKSWRPFGKQ